VEIGGILFGRRDANESRIEAFRQIESQHAFGPSFILSENDLAGIRKQLESYREDNDLATLEPLGWFIGHTRSPLQLTDREAGWFEELFPFAGAICLLVKPEKFQPTRFGFLRRSPDGTIERDAARDAVILPLSAGAATPRPPSSSVPARAPVTVTPPAPAEEEKSIADPEEAAPEPMRTYSQRTHRAQPEPPVSAKLPEPPQAELPSSSRSVSTGASTRVRHQSPASMPPPVPSPSFPYATVPERPRTGSSFGLQSALVLVLAAILGCVAGYWAYLQLPSPVIPVSVREQNNKLVVEWPSALTENVDYAALQVNDGQWVTLSLQEKTAGHAVVTAPPGDVKIDLLAKHWLRDSRGIVRYLRR
jgi:hypothetical protein